MAIQLFSAVIYFPIIVICMIISQIYFEHGHWGIKVRQTLVALICWLTLFTPIVITSATYLAYLTHGRHGHFFWHYTEGFQELNFLVIFLTFALGMIAVFLSGNGIHSVPALSRVSQ